MKYYYERKFNILGVKGIYRKRAKKSRGYAMEKGKCFIMFHFGKQTIIIEKRKPSKPLWKTWAK